MYRTPGLNIEEVYRQTLQNEDHDVNDIKFPTRRLGKILYQITDLGVLTSPELLYR